MRCKTQGSSWITAFYPITVLSYGWAHGALGQSKRLTMNAVFSDFWGQVGNRRRNRSGPSFPMILHIQTRFIDTSRDSQTALCQIMPPLVPPAIPICSSRFSKLSSECLKLRFNSSERKIVRCKRSVLFSSSWPSLGKLWF